MSAGGYADRRLSDLPLRWMQDKASALGLGLDPAALGSENYRGPFTDSYLGFLKGVYAKKNSALPFDRQEPIR
jgi:hypothetical protein